MAETSDDRVGSGMSDSNGWRQAAESVVRSLRGSEEVLAIWHFGATQRGRGWEGSDVDLLVLLDGEPEVAESHSERAGQSVHLHWIGREALERALQPQGDPVIQGYLGHSGALFDRGDWEARVAPLRAFPDDHRLFHLVSHLESLLFWARDLRKRMALRDERPRRAAARQWEVDQHSAAVLLIEKGLFPHNEATTQALDARIFVPNMADPAEIEAFVAPRVGEWLLPRLAAWHREGGDFDAASLHARYGLAPAPLLLDFAAARGSLRPVRSSGRGATPLQERLYRPA